MNVEFTIIVPGLPVVNVLAVAVVTQVVDAAQCDVGGIFPSREKSLPSLNLDPVSSYRLIQK